MSLWSSLTGVPKIPSTVPTLTAILILLVLVGAGCTRTAEKKFHGDSLQIDHRYAQEIEFSALDTRVPLGRNAYVRVDGPVTDTREYLNVLVRELGVTDRRFHLTNPATNGMQVHFRFRDGRECSFIWARSDADSRLTKSRIEHEKYHALCRLAPQATSTLSAKILQLGFRLSLADFDEEFAATLIEVITLHRLGIALDDIHGSELVVKAVELLKANRTEPNKDAAAPLSSVDQQITVRWPQGKDAIVVPFELLDDMPVIRCQLNGKASFLYGDMARQPITLYQDRLARFGLKVAGEVDSPPDTAGGNLERIRFCGGFILSFQDGLSMEVSGAPCVPGGGRAPHHDVDGILGVKIMKALHGVIDLEASKITFSVKAAPNQSRAANERQPLGANNSQTPAATGSRR